ncbi:MAG TPA: phosphatase PAP2 family protein [Thermoleophilia bacterium]|nr:phosphatase PAP2 family protein [Thermoleophilia bacterium]
MGSLDYTLFHAINGLAGRVGWIDTLAARFAEASPYIVVGLLVVLWFLGRGPQRQLDRQAVIHALAATAVAAGIGTLLASAVDRTRPFLSHPAHVLVAKSFDGSFPSIHATAAFAVATAVIFYNRAMGIVFLVLAALIAFSRVFVGLHYPGDVLAGALLGAGCAAALLAARPLLKRATQLVTSAWSWAHLP